jgi:hypothetical protein
MENPFKEIIHNELLPEIIKKRVVDDINLIKLSLDLADLFMVKYPNTLEEFLKDPKPKK